MPKTETYFAEQASHVRQLLEEAYQKYGIMFELTTTGFGQDERVSLAVIEKSDEGRGIRLALAVAKNVGDLYDVANAYVLGYSMAKKLPAETSGADGK